MCVTLLLYMLYLNTGTKLSASNQYQWRLVGIFESRTAARIIMGLIRRPNRSFLSAHSLSYLCLMYIYFWWHCGQTLVMVPPSWNFYITFNDAPQSVGLLWTTDQLDTETSLADKTQHSQETSVSSAGFDTRDPSQRTAVDPRLRPRGHNV